MFFCYEIYQQEENLSHNSRRRCSRENKKKRMLDVLISFTIVEHDRE